MVYFLLKYLIEFTNETIWPRIFSARYFTFINICIYKIFLFTHLLTISSAFHSFLRIRISIWCISLQPKELSLAFPVVQVCWQWILLFLSSENVIISPSFLKNIFTGDIIPDWPFFFPNQLITGVFALSTGLYDYWWEVSENLSHCHPVCIKIFSLHLIFSILTMICLDIIFFVFFHGIHFMYSHNRNLQPLYPQTFSFLPHALSLLLLGLQFLRW